MLIVSFIKKHHKWFLFGIVLVVLIFVVVHENSKKALAEVGSPTAPQGSVSTPPPIIPVLTPLDKSAYDTKILQLANGDTHKRWPVTAPYPTDGAILPFKRIVAFYGNFYSKDMGVLGAYAPDVVLSKLAFAVSQWEAADPTTPVQPAIHYIAVVAQGYAGSDKLYVSRMPSTEIDKALALADQAHAIVFLDIQPGKSTVQKEVPLLEAYLKMPNVHLGIDPEFYMKNGKKPGTAIGSMDASDINFVSAYLAKLVDDNHLPPKILVIHRFTGPMVTHYKEIKTLPEVQLVMDMDGWGTVQHKTDTYNQVIAPQPVQFTGFKLFFKNDTTRSKSRMMKPEEVLKLIPQPSYIQYQ